MEREPVAMGDDELFEQLYPALRRWAAVTGPPGVEPDDLVQEAVARTLRHHTLGELDDPGAYLRRTIVHLAANQRRGMARLRRAVTRIGRDDEGRTPEYASDLSDLLHLAPASRALLYLVVVEGHSYAEAANALGISEEAARTRASRARRRLRLDIQEEQ
jgi:RNA polymerase sigma-70 factor (ECF subfamily)